MAEAFATGQYNLFRPVERAVKVHFREYQSVRWAGDGLLPPAWEMGRTETPSQILPKKLETRVKAIFSKAPKGFRETNSQNRLDRIY